MKLKVRFAVEYDTEIEIDDLSDAVMDIFIPEGDDSKYVDDSYEIVSVRDQDDNPVTYPQ